MSRAKDQDQDEPDTPPGTQTRSISWTSNTILMRELRGWLNSIPDQAVITVFVVDSKDRVISATWEIT